MVAAQDITFEQFRAGLKAGFPIFLSYLPIGIAFGVLAHNYGFTPFQAILMSTLVLSGSGQFVALSTLFLSGSILASVLASFIVNLRYALHSVVLSTHLHGLRMRVLTWLAYTLTDETFALNSAAIRENKASPGSMLGLGTIAWLGWIFGTTLGTFGSLYLGDLSAFGIHFAIPAMYCALFVALASNLRQLWCGIGASLIVVALYGLNLLGLGLQIYWFSVITALIAATIAVFVFRKQDERDDLRATEAAAAKTAKEGS